jgi:hypothetical protein
LTVKKLEIRWKPDHFLSRIGALNPGIPVMARSQDGSRGLTDFLRYSFRICQGSAGFPDPIFLRLHFDGTLLFAMKFQAFRVGMRSHSVLAGS